MVDSTRNNASNWITELLQRFVGRIAIAEES